MKKILQEQFNNIKSKELSYIKNKDIYSEIIQLKKYIGIRKFESLYSDINIARLSSTWYLYEDYNIMLMEESDVEIERLIFIERILESEYSLKEVNLDKMLQVLVKLPVVDIISVWKILKNILKDYNTIVFNDDNGIILSPLKLSAKFDEYIIPMTNRKYAIFVNSDIFENNQTGFIITTCINLDTNVVSHLRNVTLRSVINDHESISVQVIEEAESKGMCYNGNSYNIENLFKTKQNNLTYECYMENMTIYNVLKNGTLKDLQNYNSLKFKESNLYKKSYLEAKSLYEQSNDEFIYEELSLLHMIRALLLKTVLIKKKTKKSPENKLHELLIFINDYIGALLSREIQICYSYLKNENYTVAFFKKIQRENDISADVLSMAWDLFHIRAIYNDYIHYNNPNMFDYNCFFTFDKGIKEIIENTHLRALIREEGKAQSTPVFESSFDSLDFKSKTIKEATNYTKRFSDLEGKRKGLLNLIDSLEDEWKEFMHK